MFFKDTNNLITRCVNYEMDDIKYTSNKESGIWQWYEKSTLKHDAKLHKKWRKINTW